MEGLYYVILGDEVTGTRDSFEIIKKKDDAFKWQQFGKDRWLSPQAIVLQIMSKCLHTLGQGTFASGKTIQHGKLVQGRQKQDQTHVEEGL